MTMAVQTALFETAAACNFSFSVFFVVVLLEKTDNDLRVHIISIHIRKYDTDNYDWLYFYI